ncbi:MAG: anchored repeat ABC transporter, substrate-binding protein [Actinotignum sanguinis]|uniref:anchored repeat ABC transporter, substrate-binding protein n=1 Tax=Actinotignum sanguinis TaxID=1445614 RepID=UPI00237DE811|nr:anchored repeat ABC transporter, substrate-binding protein [Actinotignum sanguinis]MDE1552193.1 anchored repeat ABC transporter, substrate-binding protein [Actinotignum sanguinis]MDE1565466.1 anchored repeat ABC transporter, substrate-binding protein [Actinotignum sanguinis]MDK8286141.1 anchored repeat ABC transporter, substrate-binding protein [Actinotignum sanguinis]MDK8650994.1 anchored repeat ABC transporter, substrate-binding protein [Actinotignum sanguinis]MDK8656635.1 anchored repeat
MMKLLPAVASILAMVCPAGIPSGGSQEALAGSVSAAGVRTRAETGDRNSDAPRVVASTPILADLAQNVLGERGEVTSLVPPGADPHSFEPSLRSLRELARADIVFSNQLLLEDQALLATMDATRRPGVKNVGLGEAAVAYGARHIALVEDAALSTVWLGFRAGAPVAPQSQEGNDAAPSTPTTSAPIVSLRALSVTGPGTLAAFTTGTFGQPKVYIDSSRDELGHVDLPAQAHTHMSWAFSAPGVYELRMRAEVQENGQSRSLGEGTVVFAVGVDPATTGRSRVIDAGHVDITMADSGAITLRGEIESARTTEVSPDSAVIAVPHTVATHIPGDPAWRFLGRAGDTSWVLAQAVLGEHVHGDVDPHLWLDASNAVAYVETIAAELSALDPAGAPTYAANAQAYIARLQGLDEWLRGVVASIPARQRKLVTAHDGFGYLARAYGLDTVGFVTPNPALEPSARQLANLTHTLMDLRVPAVFGEPTTASHAGELRAVASAAGVAVCQLYSDSFDGAATTYEAMMIANGRALKNCLDPGALPAWPPDYEVPRLPLATAADQLPATETTKDNS